MSVSGSWPHGGRCRDGSRSEGGRGEGEKRTANQLKDVQNTTVSLLKFDAQDQRFLIPSTFLCNISSQRSQKAHCCLRTHVHVQACTIIRSIGPQMRGVLGQCPPHPKLLNSVPHEAGYLAEPNMASRNTHTHGVMQFLWEKVN